MLQTAVFVDAGYLFAQGATLLSSARLSRDRLALNVSGVVAALTEAAHRSAPDARLLRIYWYDGLIRGGALTAEQSTLRQAADVKLRLGMVNSRGEQKGVDSLIVTDLIELARNDAISDALIISGDEDIRVGVQVAQTFGVRVHLVGIRPARGSQSPDLIAEADSYGEWGEDVVGSCLTVKVTRSDVVASGGAARAGGDDFGAVAADQARMIVAEFAAQLSQIVGYLDANGDAIPSEVDRPSLARLRDRIGRDLTFGERKAFRASLADEIRRSARSE